MNNYITPNIGYREYLPKEVIRVINPRQQKLYIKHGVFPIDLYTIQDNRSDGDILVMIFLKDETQDLYEAWLDHTLV